MSEETVAMIVRTCAGIAAIAAIVFIIGMGFAFICACYMDWRHK